MNQENCYILLELDPTVEDQRSIEAAILNKQREWGRLRNHPSKGTLANKLLSDIPTIREVMLTAESRKKEAEEAIIIQLNKEKEKR